MHSGSGFLQRRHGQDSQSHCLQKTFGSSIGEAFCSDFNFADDIALLSEMYDSYLSLVYNEEEASELDLHTNWLKNEVPSLSDFLPWASYPTIHGGAIEVVEIFQCRRMLIHKS